MKTFFFKSRLTSALKWEYIPKTILFKQCFITETRFSAKSRAPFLFLFPVESWSQPLATGDGLTTNEITSTVRPTQVLPWRFFWPENMESESFHDVGQGANQESKTWLLFPVGPADSKRGFLQVGHGPGSSNMGGQRRKAVKKDMNPDIVTQ